MQYKGSSSLISCEKQTIQIELLTLQGKPKHTTCRGTPSHTYKSSHKFPGNRTGITALAYNVTIVNGYRRATAALVPTIGSMGEPVSGPVRGKVCEQVQSGTRLIGYHISRHVFSTFKRLTQVSTH